MVALQSTVMHLDDLTLREKEDRDRLWIEPLLFERWGSAQVVSRGRLHQADQLPGIVAEIKSQPVGYLTYNIEGDSCEVITLDSLRPRIGIGKALLQAIEARARQADSRRLWLVTTNDNSTAIAFYEACGFQCVAVHKGAVGEARRIKPEIPTHTAEGVPIEDEWEYERWLEPRPS